MAELGHLLADDASVIVRGRIDARDDQPKLIVMELRRPELSLDGGPPLRLKVPPHLLTDATVKKLKETLQRFPGASTVFMHVGDTVLRLPDEFCTQNSTALAGEIRVLLGPDCLL
jgi:DNA polymerase-3 subunit alpha